jgi:hypothetical protein
MSMCTPRLLAALVAPIACVALVPITAAQPAEPPEPPEPPEPVNPQTYFAPPGHWLSPSGKFFFGEAARPPAQLAGDRGLCDGWPVNLTAPGAGFPYTPTLFDIDGDGADEIFLTGGDTFGLNGDGTFLPGWPTADHLYMGYATNTNKPGPSCADLEGDGDIEVMWTERDWWAGSSAMWTFNGREPNGSNMPNLPAFAPDDYSNALDTPFVLADADGNGILEAWGAHTLGNNFLHYRVSAIDHTGTRLFTTDVNPAENILSLYWGDLDGDGGKEIFTVSWLEPNIRLHVFEPDGDIVPGYPITLYTLASGNLMFGPPVPFDLDDDGDLEILLGRWGGGASYAECRHHDGTGCTGFPIQIATESQLFYMGLGDITGDGAPELLALDNWLGYDYRAIAIDLATGASLPGWPYVVPDWPKAFPAVADIDDDGKQDVIFVTAGGLLYALASDGSLLTGYPKTMMSPSISGVAVGDIDADGLFELVAATWDGWVYAWDTTGPALPGRADWPMRGLDARNTGVFIKSGASCPADVNGDDVVDVLDLLAIIVAWGNPGGAEDVNGDGIVDVLDLLAVITAWGPC